MDEAGNNQENCRRLLAGGACWICNTVTMILRYSVTKRWNVLQFVVKGRFITFKCNVLAIKRYL